MSHDHYFTAEPGSPDTLREVTVELAGREVTVVAAGGVFSPGGLDKGTAVLLREVPDPPAEGVFLDLGCGWGPVALTLALRSPGATVHAVDVNRRALDLVRRNAEALGCTNVVASEPDEVPEGTRFDLIWSNPPVRVGKAVLHELLLTWLPRLAPGGEAWLVVQKNLGADSLHAWLRAEMPERFEISREASHQGFRVLRVAAPA